jgi:hypothetical protein
MIEQIREQLRRLGAGGVAGIDPYDTIVVADLGHGDVLLTASPVRSNFYWHGPASDVLARLSGLPDRSGAHAIRSEFQSSPGTSE